MTFETIGAGQIPYWSAILFQQHGGHQSHRGAVQRRRRSAHDMMAGRIDYYFIPSVLLWRTGQTASACGDQPESVPLLSRRCRRCRKRRLPATTMPAWRSLMGPAGVRRDIVASLNGALAERSRCPTCAKDARRRIGSRTARLRSSRNGMPTGSSVLADREASRITPQ